MASTSVQASASLQSRDLEPPNGQSSTATHHALTYIETSSDFSDFDDHLFFGADFNTVDLATPSFLDDATWGQTALPQNELADAFSYPLTPTHTASPHTTSLRRDCKDLGAIENADTVPKSVSPRQLEKNCRPPPGAANSSIITPSFSSSNRISEDSLAPAFVPMHSQSPRVIISVWGKDGDAPVHTAEHSLEDSSGTVCGGIDSTGDIISAAHDGGLVSGPHDPLNPCQQDTGSRRAGLDPRNRPSDRVHSINEVVAQRSTRQRNQNVGRWLSHNLNYASAPIERSPEEIQAIESPKDDDNDIPLGHRTENRCVPGQTYFEGPGGEISDIDREIIASCRNWADAPMIPEIHMSEYGRNQPETAQAAIARFERMCRDNDSIISRSATWGTRRRSFPSVIDVEGVTSGNFLKKLSISRGSGEKPSRPGSFLRDLRGLVRWTSVNQVRKRSRSRSCGRSVSCQDGATEQEEMGQSVQRESTPRLSPQLGSPSGDKKAVPSINTTLAFMGQNIASMWTGHSRSSSVSGASAMTSSRPSLGNLTVKSSLRRPRSKSEIPKSSTSAAGIEGMSSLVDMWRRTGGPPVAPVSRLNEWHTATADNEADEDDDELYDDNDMRTNPNVIDDITPGFAGFQQHVVKLNPGLGDNCGYLVDRIAHQQIVRYKNLLTAKIKHLSQGANCASGSLCVALGGPANILEQKEDPKGPDPLTTELEDDERLPTEGAINQLSFPPGIPMPPAPYLPAEVECQLCFQRKKFHKPSDWTKHVHEDVQPFTCTWDKCRDPKTFKRKADWVRHENEGHRHLEWWTCDVDDCRHTCYRRDNFLQHLVREHKFSEPKVKTKTAMKRAGGMDPTWQKVEQCHGQTTARPQDEACRFCGKVFPTWKKLTVHLAKHMEQISLPVLRLVTAKAKELAADTIISPVQDFPPRQTVPLPLDSSTPSTQVCDEQHLRPQQQQQQQQQQPRHGYNGQQDASFQPANQFVYPVIVPGFYQQEQMYHHQFENTGQSLQQPNLSVETLDAGCDVNQQVREMTSTHADGYLSSSNNDNFRSMPEGSDMEPFSQFNMNALGLRHVGDEQIGGQLSGHIRYDAMMDSSTLNGGALSGYESRSIYPHSPHSPHSNVTSSQSRSAEPTATTRHMG